MVWEQQVLEQMGTQELVRLIWKAPKSIWKPWVWGIK